MIERGPGSMVKDLEDLGILPGAERAGDWDADLALTGLSVDSRETRPGHLFFALPGSRWHGATFLPFAQRMGAAAAVTDAEGLRLAEAEAGALGFPILVHPDPRRALALAARRWYPGQPETMVAVTGTNGKTSVASFTRQIWERMGIAAVNFGTTGVEGAVAAPLAHTTPEPLTLHRLLARLCAEGVSHGAMEASSHGLAQRRLDGVTLRAAAFTNISRDHLDYHSGFDDYLRAKAGLFERVLPRDGTAVVNIDDAAGPALAETAAARRQRVLRVGRGEGADLRLLGQRFDGRGQDLRFALGGGRHLVRLDLIGGFQGANALLAAGLAWATGAEPPDLVAGLEALRPVRGRMQRVAERQNGATVYVDYAHTPDALAVALQALRPHVMGRLIVVFGAGGARAPGKRALMGAAAHAHAASAIVTADNPRSEDPARIRAAVLSALPGGTEIGDRATAILAGVDALEPGDTLLIAGKGHESGQIVGDDILPFDDAEQASIAVAALEGQGA